MTRKNCEAVNCPIYWTNTKHDRYIQLHLSLTKSWANELYNRPHSHFHFPIGKFQYSNHVVNEILCLTCHDFLRHGVELRVHHKLGVLGKLDHDHAEVGTPQIQGHVFSSLRSVRQTSDIRREAADAAVGFAKSFLKKHPD